MKRYLKLTEDEIFENQRLWAEENSASDPLAQDSGEGLGAVGGVPMPSMSVDNTAQDQENSTGTESPISGNQGADSTDL